MKPENLRFSKSFFLNFFSLLILIAVSCSKEEIIDPSSKEIEKQENLPPASFTISVKDITDSSATLEWEVAKDPEGKEVTYFIYLNDQLYAESGNTFLDLVELEEITAYEVKVIARDPEENERIAITSFETSKYYHTFKISLWHEPEDVPVDLKNDYIETGDDHLIFIGTFMDKQIQNAAEQKVVIYKITLDGEIVWKRLVPSLLINDFPVAKIKEAEDGGFVVITVKKIIRFDQEGTVQWIKELENASAFYELRDIVSIPGQGYFAVGNKTRETYIGNQVFLKKLDYTGNTVWEKIFGESYDQNVESIVSNGDGTYTFLASKENSGIPYDLMGSNHPEYNPDFWLVTIDTEGELIWENTYGGINEDEFFISQLIKTKDKGFAFVGLTHQGVNRYRSLYRLSEDGNLLWQNTNGNGTDLILSVTEAGDGGFYTVGAYDTCGANRWLNIQKIDSGGNLEYENRYYKFNYNSYGGWLKELENGQLIIHFATRDFYRDILREDIFIVKTQPRVEFDNWKFE